MELSDMRLEIPTIIGAQTIDFLRPFERLPPEKSVTHGKVVFGRRITYLTTLLLRSCLPTGIARQTIDES